ncbi:hypothetical protein ACH4TV_45455 [Streptomyces sp. NPDC020898]|uniref:hypothetical protein n=1 Tax=Streptomyces sp. NPDC020898 TaxID=3365101 RepID=UPI0037AFB7AF
MTGDSWRERRRALLREDPGAAEKTARLLDEMGIEDRDDAEIEADHRASRLAAAREYAPDVPLNPVEHSGSVEFAVRLPDDLDAEVRKAAADAGLSLDAYVVRALRRHTLRAAPAAVDSEGALLGETGRDDPAEDIR